MSNEPSGVSEVSAEVGPSGVGARAGRVAVANACILAIASHGRRFFWYSKIGSIPSVSHFVLDHRGRVWFVDCFTGKHVYTHTSPYQRWKGFTNGGTLRRLCERLRDYIMGRAPFPIASVGPADVWGYDPAEMDAVVAKCSVLLHAAGRTTHEKENC